MTRMKAFAPCFKLKRSKQSGQSIKSTNVHKNDALHVVSTGQFMVILVFWIAI